MSVAPETVSVAPETVPVAPEGGSRPDDAPAQNPTGNDAEPVQNPSETDAEPAQNTRKTFRWQDAENEDIALAAKGLDTEDRNGKFSVLTLVLLLAARFGQAGRAGLVQALYSGNVAEPEFQNEPGIGMQEIERPVEVEEDGLRHLRIDIRRALPDRRLDKYLAGRLGYLSRTSLQQYIRDGAVTVNGRVVKPSYTIQTGDVILMLVPEPQVTVIQPEPIPIEIIYEDDDILIINKQAGLLVHPAKGNRAGTLLNGLAWLFQQRQQARLAGMGADAPGGSPAPAEEKGALAPLAGDAARPGIVHRLDRDTTGVMVLAKTDLALWRLGRQFELRRVHKTYQAIVHGQLELDEDVIDAPIGEHPRIRERYAVHRDTGRPLGITAKPAITRYKVLRRLPRRGALAGGFSFVELYPKTGRTHQLRVHMSYIGHPIVGDPAYGGGPIYRSQLEGRPDVAEGPIITRQALHARRIEFQHPRTLNIVNFAAPLPNDFVQALEALGGGSAAV